MRSNPMPLWIPPSRPMEREAQPPVRVGHRCPGLVLLGGAGRHARLGDQGVTRGPVGRPHQGHPGGRSRQPVGLVLRLHGIGGRVRVLDGEPVVEQKPEVLAGSAQLEIGVQPRRVRLAVLARAPDRQPPAGGQAYHRRDHGKPPGVLPVPQVPPVQADGVGGAGVVQLETVRVVVVLVGENRGGIFGHELRDHHPGVLIRGREEKDQRQQEGGREAGTHAPIPPGNPPPGRTDFCAPAHRADGNHTPP